MLEVEVVCINKASNVSEMSRVVPTNPERDINDVFAQSKNKLGACQTRAEADWYELYIVVRYHTGLQLLLDSGRNA